MSYRDPAVGLCPKFGKRQPEPDRSICEPCAGRARDARLRAEGKPRRAPERAKSCQRGRSRRQAAAQLAAGGCTKCGANPPQDGQRLCAGKRRAADRRRYAEASARGQPYGGKEPEAKRRSARLASAKRRQAWLDAGVCTQCGRQPSIEGGTTCGSCLEARRVVDRERYDARRAAGLCVSCGRPAFDGQSRCSVCAAVEAKRRDKDGKNERVRERYARRRARSGCSDCGRPAFGACRCLACAARSHKRSAHFMGIPAWDTQFIVVELATGAEHGPYESEAEAAASLVFAKLSRDRVEIVSDAPVTATATGRS